MTGCFYLDEFRLGISSLGNWRLPWEIVINCFPLANGVSEGPLEPPFSILLLLGPDF